VCDVLFKVTRTGRLSSCLLILIQTILIVLRYEGITDCSTSLDVEVKWAGAFSFLALAGISFASGCC
jgi:hypothetical protein